MTVLRRFCAAVVVVLLGGIASPGTSSAGHREGPPRITVTDIEAPEGQTLSLPVPAKIDARGAVLVNVADSSGRSSALWENGRLTAITADTASDAGAADLSDHGRVAVGVANRRPCEEESGSWVAVCADPLLWDDGEATLLPTDGMAGLALHVSNDGSFVVGTLRRWVPERGFIHELAGWVDGELVRAPEHSGFPGTDYEDVIGVNNRGQALELPEAILLQRQANADGSSFDMWMDEATGLTRMISFDAAGNPDLYDESSVTIKNPDGTVTLRQVRVDHSKGEWYEYELTRPFDPMFDRFGEREADRIRSGIAKGGYVEDGLDVIDGQELLRLLSADPCSDTVYEEEGVTWVDAETYRPVARLGYPGEDYKYTHNYEFLERTPENLKLLEPEIPDGFVQVEAPELGPPPNMENFDPDAVDLDQYEELDPCDLSDLGVTTTIAAP